MGPLGLSVRGARRGDDGADGAFRRTSRACSSWTSISAGPARLARLRAGHVLLEINRRRIGSVAEFQDVVAALTPGATVAVLIFDQLPDQRVIATITPDSLP